jgi:5,10-methylenetetrahydrofolate reductase
VFQYVTDSIIAGVYSILILRGDEPVIGNKIFDIPPTRIIKTLSEHNFDNFIKLDLSFPNSIESSIKVKNKLEARPRAFVTQSISSIENLKAIVELSKPYNIDVIPCIMCPSKRNEVSAKNIGLDWSSYVNEPEKFVYNASNLTDKVLLCSPNSFEDGLDLVRRLKKN